MSHYLTITIQCKDQDALVRALQRVKVVGGTKGQWTKNMIEVHEKADSLYGYHGDKRSQKAHVIIRRQYVQGSANDIGFEKQADGNYIAHISEFDSTNYNEKWQQQLMTYYGVEVAKAEAEKAGHTVEESIDSKGRIQLHIDYTVVEKTAKTGGIRVMNW